MLVFTFLIIKLNYIILHYSVLLCKGITLSWVCHITSLFPYAGVFQKRSEKQNHEPTQTLQYYL